MLAKDLGHSSTNYKVLIPSQLSNEHGIKFTWGMEGLINTQIKRKEKKKTEMYMKTSIRGILLCESKPCMLRKVAAINSHKLTIISSP